MRLCLVRHGIAVERGLPGFADDASRPLTPGGRERMREAAAGLRLLVPEGVLLTSPLVRARQTAEILQEAFAIPGIRVCEALASGDHEALFADADATGAEIVFAVGHEPYMSEALALALTGDAAGMSAVFKKGAAALVNFHGPAGPGRGELEWLMQPAALRAIGSQHPGGI